MVNWREKFPQLLHQERYSILRQIGTGGMAVVFQCKDIELDDIVAIKILKPEYLKSQDMINRFKQEIKLARKISHRNICRIYDFGSFEELFYIVMEYLEGVALSSVIRVKDALPDEKKLPIAVKILQGLESAHTENIVHHDLKPGNIMIIKNLEPVIMDFGLARYYNKDDKEKTDKSLFGTPAYMSPEQIVGLPVDHRADIYSFGVILYELLTQHFPYQEDSLYNVLHSHVNDEPIPPKKFVPELDPRIEKILMKCLEKNPLKRYETVSPIITDIMETFSTSAEKKSQTAKKKVLIAEDEPAIRRMFKRMFQLLGLEVELASDGREAIEKAFSVKPDLICLDIMMPIMSGLEAAEILLSAQQTKNIPIVILSAKSSQEYMLYSRQLGIKDYIVKPITYSDIERRINYWLQP